MQFCLISFIKNIYLSVFCYNCQLHKDIMRKARQNGGLDVQYLRSLLDSLNTNDKFDERHQLQKFVRDCRSKIQHGESTQISKDSYSSLRYLQLIGSQQIQRIKQQIPQILSQIDRRIQELQKRIIQEQKNNETKQGTKSARTEKQLLLNFQRFLFRLLIKLYKKSKNKKSSLNKLTKKLEYKSKNKKREKSYKKGLLLKLLNKQKFRKYIINQLQSQLKKQIDATSDKQKRNQLKLKTARQLCQLMQADQTKFSENLKKCNQFYIELQPITQPSLQASRNTVSTNNPIFQEKLQQPRYNDEQKQIMENQTTIKIHDQQSEKPVSMDWQTNEQKKADENDQIFKNQNQFEMDVPIDWFPINIKEKSINTYIEPKKYKKEQKIQNKKYVDPYLSLNNSENHNSFNSNFDQTNNVLLGQYNRSLDGQNISSQKKGAEQVHYLNVSQ